jgi:hypothetical protein
VRIIEEKKMVKISFGCGCVLLLASALTALAADKDDPKPKEEKDVKEAKEQLVSKGEVDGIVTAVDGAAHTLTVKVYKDVVLQGAEEVKVRLTTLPPVYDDKGHARKYTSQELKDLKGSGNLPGYKGDFSDLKKGQVVRVKVARKKMTSQELKEAEKSVDGVKLYATLVVIVADPEK